MMSPCHWTARMTIRLWGLLLETKARVIVVAATNRPEDCDPALLRRFAVRVLVALPTKRDRKKIISRLLLDVNHSITKSQLDALACSTEGWSGSDLESMTREAVMAPVRETLRAAAILKRRASKNQQSGANSSEEKNGNIDLIRDSLLIGFRNLRPVSSRDFEDGIAFFLGDSESAFGHFGGGSRHAHYDSSDSSEDEEENNS
jgi:SpoVK/Ycf46/Vps4 family AAA+-type ATPase